MDRSRPATPSSPTSVTDEQVIGAAEAVDVSVDVAVDVVVYVDVAVDVAVAGDVTVAAATEEAVAPPVLPNFGNLAAPVGDQPAIQVFRRYLHEESSQRARNMWSYARGDVPQHNAMWHRPCFRENARLVHDLLYPGTTYARDWPQPGMQWRDVPTPPDLADATLALGRRTMQQFADARAQAGDNVCVANEARRLEMIFCGLLAYADDRSEDAPARSEPDSKRPRLST